MPNQMAGAAQRPQIHNWPWKPTSPQRFWRCHIGRRIQLRREQMPSATPTAKSGVMSRECLALHLGIPAFNVLELETGVIAPDAALLARLAEVLNVHPGWFFDTEPLPQWIEEAERSRFIHRLSALLSPISSSDFAIIETVFRYLARRRAAAALS